MSLTNGCHVYVATGSVSLGRKAALKMFPRFLDGVGLGKISHRCTADRVKEDSQVRMLLHGRGIEQIQVSDILVTSEPSQKFEPWETRRTSTWIGGYRPVQDKQGGRDIKLKGKGGAKRPSMLSLLQIVSIVLMQGSGIRRL